jgi:hypothetical protein
MGIQFSHTIEEEIGGQLKAGFILEDIYHDINDEGPLGDYCVPTFYATKARKVRHPIRDQGMRNIRFTDFPRGVLSTVPYGQDKKKCWIPKINGEKMSKPLSEMSLEELWTLFPICLTEHKEYWVAWYEEERTFLLSFLPENVRISHIGSTAIKGIWAKPIIDILVETDENQQSMESLLLKHGIFVWHNAELAWILTKGTHREDSRRGSSIFIFESTGITMNYVSGIT